MFNGRAMLVRGFVASGILLAVTFLVLYPIMNAVQTTGQAVASGLKVLHPELQKPQRQAKVGTELR